MVTMALFVRLEAKPGKEPEVEKFLKGGLAIVEGEPATTAWFALRLGPSTFGIFDAFPNEEGGRRISRGVSRRRSCRRKWPSCSPSRPRSRSSMCSRLSFLGKRTQR